MHGAYSSAEAQRPHTRYNLATMVEIRATSLRGAVLAQLDNISLSGCYVHTPQSLAEHTRVRVIVQAGSRKADLWGVIRRQDQNGLGIHQRDHGGGLEVAGSHHRAVTNQEAGHFGWILEIPARREAQVAVQPDLDLVFILASARINYSGAPVPQGGVRI